MTLREILTQLKQRHKYDSYNLVQLRAWEELEERVVFVERLIEDGIDLEMEFCFQMIWNGGPLDVN